MINIETVYQYSIKEDPTMEADWNDCTKDQYMELDGYAPIRKIERVVPHNGWDDLWDEFMSTPEYKQSIAALRFRAYVDWLKDNFYAPTKK